MPFMVLVAGPIDRWSQDFGWDDEVLSDIALTEIAPWFAVQPLWRKREIIEKIYIVNHKQGDYFGLTPQVIPVKLSGFAVPIKLCMDVGCVRCGSGPPWEPVCVARGGYRFQWLGPWTKNSLVPRGITPNAWRVEINRRAQIINAVRVAAIGAAERAEAFARARDAAEAVEETAQEFEGASRR